ncbi:MAG: DNA-binding response regulator [Nitrosopumilales archaeon]|nr:MAG: DNA-binding response regulator [Nitrosopumilales archaeon]
MRILAIDDNRTITNMICEYLSSHGHDCVVSNDGREGLAMILEQRFDAILLDLAMPKFSGYDIIESLIQAGKIKENNILVFSAGDVAEVELKKLQDNGVNCSIHKTTDMLTLEKTIQSMVDKENSR